MFSEIGESFKRFAGASIFLLLAILGSTQVQGQAPIGNEGYTFKVYYTNYAYYPIVQAYLRTWDLNRKPLDNVNYANLGLMVAGRSYDPAKYDPTTRRPQYDIDTLQNRSESFRTVIVLDCSKSMAGKPFADAQNALMKYVEAKRPMDQVAVIAITDDKEGYLRVSGFEKDPGLLYQRIQDVKCDAETTRLYDSLAAAMELCATSSQGAIDNTTPDFAVLSTIIVLSDGKDEGSAVSREELVNRIGQLPIPIPVYSLAYSSQSKEYFKNLEAVSKASFGQYWTAEETQEFASTLQGIHQINRSDYVVTFRSYVPVDGDKHNYKVGISWPSKSGRAVYQSAEFEAIESPAAFHPSSVEAWKLLQGMFPPLPNPPGPYMTAPGADAPAPVAPPAPEAPKSSASAETESSSESAGVVSADPPAPSDGPKPGSGPDASKESTPLDFAMQNIPLLGVGFGIFVLTVLVVVWVRGNGAPYDSASTRSGAGTNGNSGTTGGQNRSTDGGNLPTEHINNVSNLR